MSRGRAAGAAAGAVMVVVVAAIVSVAAAVKRIRGRALLGGRAAPGALDAGRDLMRRS